MRIIYPSGESGAEEVLAVSEMGALSLHRLLIDKPGLEEKIALKCSSSTSASSLVNIRLQLDDDTAEYCIGSTLLSVSKTPIYLDIPAVIPTYLPTYPPTDQRRCIFSSSHLLGAGWVFPRIIIRGGNNG